LRAVDFDTSEASAAAHPEQNFASGRVQTSALRTRPTKRRHALIAESRVCGVLGAALRATHCDYLPWKQIAKYRDWAGQFINANPDSSPKVPSERIVTEIMASLLSRIEAVRIGRCGSPPPCRASRCAVQRCDNSSLERSMRQAVQFDKSSCTIAMPRPRSRKRERAVRRLARSAGEGPPDHTRLLRSVFRCRLQASWNLKRSTTRVHGLGCPSDRGAGAGSNPHGAFAPEDFKSFDYNEKLFVLLALFRANVKVCKFMCKY
jgi:hypothetical protein